MLGRDAAVRTLWNETELCATAVFGAVELVDRVGGFPVSLLTLQAAAWISYKAHATEPFDKVSDFDDYVLHGMQCVPGLRAEEMRVLQVVAFAVPMHTRVHEAREFAQGYALEDTTVDLVLLDTLRIPGFREMTHEQYVRCVAFAAAYRDDTMVPGLGGGTPEFVLEHGLRLARHS
jgi:hypothetical protein